MTDTTRALTTTGDSSYIDLAVVGWLDAHSKRKKTVEAYNDTLNQYRGEFHRIGHNLDSDVRTLAMVAPPFASFSKHPSKEQASDATFNLRLAILSSFYE